MRLSPDGTVCQVRAVALRKLVRGDNFGTVQAMAAFGLDEPGVTERLLALQADGWILYDGRVEDEDRWSATEKGHRLAATKVIKRITMDRGADILQRVIAEARLINDDPERSRRIGSIFLFGSLLTGSDDGTIGDVDIVVQTEQRRLLKPERERLEAAEEGDEQWSSDRWFRGESIIKSRLRAVSRAVSIHDEGDLRLPGVRYRQVYAFDLRRECEVPFDPNERLHPEPMKASDLAAQSKARPFSRQPRSWPTVAADRQVTFDNSDGQLAQHLWFNGLSLAVIGKRLHRKPPDVEAYLASRDAPNVIPSVAFPSLGATVSSALAPGFAHVVTAEVRIERGWGTVEVLAYDPITFDRAGRVYRGSKRDAYIDAVPIGLAKTLLAMSASATAWRDKARSKVGGLTLVAWAFVPVGKKPVVIRAPFPDFASLEEPMLRALRAMWRDRGNEEDRMTLFVEIVRPDRSKIRLRRGAYGKMAEIAVPKQLSAPINDVLRPLRAKWAPFLDGATRYSLSIDQQALDDDEVG